MARSLSSADMKLTNLPLWQNNASFLDDAVYNRNTKVDQEEKTVSPPNEWISKQVDDDLFYREELTLYNLL